MERFFSCRVASRSNCRSRSFTGCAHDNMSIFPHLLLVTDELAKVTVIEHFRSCDQQARGFRLWRERSDRRSGRESYLCLRAGMGPAK